VGVPGRLREVEAGKRISKSKVVLGPFGPGHFGSTESPHPPPPPLRSDDPPLSP
jgi:hypothetical protein